MSTQSNQEYLGWQYRNSNNLNARVSLQTRFSTEEHPWFHWVFDQFDLPQNARVLELGCGTGLLWGENLSRIPAGWSVTLSDYSQGMVREAELSLLDADLDFTFARVDAMSIPYEKASFDAVIANHMLYHVPDLAGALAEIRRVLRPGGRLYATTVGVGHMAELSEVPRKLGIRTPAGSVLTATQFNLEDSARDLARWFAQVEVERRDGALHVTEAVALVEYVMSSAQLSDEEAIRLHGFFDEEIQLKGAFRITTASGIFKAVKGSCQSVAVAS